MVEFFLIFCLSVMKNDIKMVFYLLRMNIFKINFVLWEELDVEMVRLSKLCDF